MGKPETSQKSKTITPSAAFLSIVEKEAFLGSMENDPLILQLRKMLDKKSMVFYPAAWRRYFFNREFFKRQYNPEFLRAFTDVIWEKLQESVRKIEHPFRKLPVW